MKGRCRKLPSVFLIWFGIVGFTLSVPFVLVLQFSEFSLDTWSYTFRNDSGEPVRLTGFFVDGTGVPKTITTGPRRGRFLIAPGATRNIPFETSDYRLKGVLVDFADSGRRVMVPEWGSLESKKKQIPIKKASFYPKPNAFEDRVDSILSMYQWYVKWWLLLGLLPALLAGYLASRVEIRRIRREEAGAL